MKENLKKILLILDENPRTDFELLEMVPDLTLDMLGELRDMEAIDHYNRLVFITGIGRKLVESEDKSE